MDFAAVSLSAWFAPSVEVPIPALCSVALVTDTAGKHAKKKIGNVTSWFTFQNKKKQLHKKKQPYYIWTGFFVY